MNDIKYLYLVSKAFHGKLNTAGFRKLRLVRFAIPTAAILFAAKVSRLKIQELNKRTCNCRKKLHNLLNISK
ncbi:hypothetical protein KGQ24_02670, partial [Patescibacteria group bacterium]|nr:hypothetical protein [Patescibacteria group bacterium]